MMQPRRFVIPLLTAAVMSFSSATLANSVLATVNGKPITQQDVERFLAENPAGREVESSEVLNELITRELVLQDASRQKLEQRAEVKQAIELARLNVILSSALEQAVSKPPITEAQLRTLYQEEIAKINLQEYQARHILVEDKQLAEQIITELDMGGDFAALAAKHSIDGSANDGGDLGWFMPQRMVPEFSRAVVALQKGAYTKSPVQSQFGWHVIRLDDQRRASPPPFEAVRAQLSQIVERQRLQQYLEGLREKGTVVIK